MGLNYSGTRSDPRPDLGGPAREYWDDPSFATYIGDIVAPRRDVAVSKGAYPNITRETALMTATTLRAPGSGYNRVDFGAEDKTFETKERGLEGQVDDRNRKFYATDFDYEVEVTQQVIRRIRIEKEIRMAALIFNTSTWTGATLYTDVSGAPWDVASSAIIAPVQAAKEKVRTLTGLVADTMIIGSVMYQHLIANTELKARFPGINVLTQDAIKANLAGILGLSRIIVGGAVKNTANEGIAASLSDIWSDDYAMICKLAMPGDPMFVPSVTRSFVWTPENAADLIVESYREEQTRSEIVRVRYDADEKVLDSSLGHLLKIDA